MATPWFERWGSRAGVRARVPPAGTDEQRAALPDRPDAEPPRLDRQARLLHQRAGVVIEQVAEQPQGQHGQHKDAAGRHREP